jgi:hypothetical protein
LGESACRSGHEKSSPKSWQGEVYDVRTGS